MASTSPCAPSTKSASPWSRLVQITRVASNKSRPHPTDTPKTPSEVTSTPSHIQSPGRPAKRRRISESRRAPCTANNQSPPASQPSEAHALATKYYDYHILYPAASHCECTIACPCHVEDVDCVAPLRLEQETGAQAPRTDLRTVLATKEDEESVTRETKEDASFLQPEEASLEPDEQTATPQPLESPTRSSDSISEAGSSDREELPGPQLQRGASPPVRVEHMQKRSIHDIGTIFCTRRRQLLSETRPPTRRDTSRNPPPSAIALGQDGKVGDASVELEEQQEVQKGPSDGLMAPLPPPQIGSSLSEGAAADAGAVSETRDTGAPAPLRKGSQPDEVGLQDGDQNTVNNIPNPIRQRSISRIQGDVSLLITPSTSPTSTSESQLDEHVDEATVPHEPSLPTKTKRRLNLHSGRYNSQPPQKKRKAPSKKQSAVQTTLNLNVGASAGMRECKVCETVYNPFHPEDVKVHAKRHAVVLKSGTKV